VNPVFNRRLFEQKVIESPYTMDELAWKLGINAATLYRKKTGISDFTRSEIQRISEILSLSRDEVVAVFFAEELAETQATG
jgi:hypothetical protein